MNIKDLTTEQRNPKSLHIDSATPLEIVKIINQEDKKIADAVGTQDKEIAKAIEYASKRYREGGRLIYVGAGTSGRLGILDAVELVPTYRINPERAIGLIAGGQSAMFRAVEGAEDDPQLGEKDLKDLKLNEKDIVIGLAASGRTPYVIGCLKYANQVKALTISIACVKKSEIGKYADIAIEAVVGPEVITGSTRMKAGTAQKMILNMISTGVMIKQGKVYENVMVDVMPTNSKLVDRACRIIEVATGVSESVASDTLEKADMNVAVAITMLKTGVDKEKAMDLVKEKAKQIQDKAEEIIAVAKEKGTPVVEKAANDLKERTVIVLKDVLARLEKNEDHTTHSKESVSKKPVKKVESKK